MVFKVFACCPGLTVSDLEPRISAEHGGKPTAKGANRILGDFERERDEEAGANLYRDETYHW